MPNATEPVDLRTLPPASIRVPSWGVSVVRYRGKDGYPRYMICDLTYGQTGVLSGLLTAAGGNGPVLAAAIGEALESPPKDPPADPFSAGLYQVG